MCKGVFSELYVAVGTEYTNYDMLIDPITAPKNIDSEYMRHLYYLYLKVREKDFDFMEEVLTRVKSGKKVNIKIYRKQLSICYNDGK